MSALAAPNLLTQQAQKPGQQTKQAEPQPGTPFSSVLQQKVKDSDKPAPQQDNQAQATGAAAPATQAESAAPDGTAQDTAAALVKGEYAQDALQQLLPWLQAMQGQNAQPTEATQVQADEEALPQGLPSLSADQKSNRQKQNLGVEPEAAVKEAHAKEATTAGAAANLAATTETLAADGRRKPAHESFDAALQNAGERVDGAAQQVSSHGTGGARGPEANRLHAPVGTSQWQQEFTDRIHLMSRNQEGKAELVLTPPQMGRIEVTLNIDGDKASAMFVSASPEVRTALEGAMDRLREALAGSGISLGQAHVGAESSNQSGDGKASGGQGQGQGVADSGPDATVATTAWTRHSNNMLDVFA